MPKPYIEMLDEIATEMLAERYRAVGVEPGDDWGYLVATGFFSRDPLVGAVLSTGETPCP